ncbi:hypothetical protein HBB16_08900 [Pseudonocardia sp. MCCB 268]|nr:hypothetical protein [Pseudonocardia cytotoxica]
MSIVPIARARPAARGPTFLSAGAELLRGCRGCPRRRGRSSASPSSPAPRPASRQRPAHRRGGSARACSCGCSPRRSVPACTDGSSTADPDCLGPVPPAALPDPARPGAGLRREQLPARLPSPVVTHRGRAGCPVVVKAHFKPPAHLSRDRRDRPAGARGGRRA